MAVISLFPIDAENYAPSALHGEDRVWVETNCYVDIWIELLHTQSFESEPALAFTLSVDFDGDQWQFFKFPIEDLRALYGIEAAEMNPWRGLEHHIEEQLGMGRTLIAEVDSYYLPDTARVSYHLEHVKTSIAPNLIDREQRRLGYFHNAGYYELAGDDFDDLLRRAPAQPGALLPYVELVKFERARRPDARELLQSALALVRTHVARRPDTNPVQRFRKRLDEDLEWLAADGLATFHQYAFATLRQIGSASELAGSLCAWLAANGEPTAEIERELCELASTTKTAQFQLARWISGRATDFGPALDRMERGWDATTQMLVERYA